MPEVLNAVSGKYRLVLITKGDLIHQTRKITTSGLAHHFHDVEVVNEKDPETYASILIRLGVKPEHFCMVGNSVKSDVLPLLTIGAHAVHVPYPLTWALELADASHLTFDELESITDFPAWLDALTPSELAELHLGDAVVAALVQDERRSLAHVGLMFSAEVPTVDLVPDRLGGLHRFLVGEVGVVAEEARRVLEHRLGAGS